MSTVRTFLLDKTLLATRIYRDFPHQTTSVGLVVDQTMRYELSRFLEAFLVSVGCTEHLFLRVDAFVQENILHVIEINVELQDGWGVALNLLRASGHAPKFADDVRLPKEIIAYSEDYLPEFELAEYEFALLGREMRIAEWRDRPGILSKSVFDDKLYLAEFSRAWRGDRVRTPLAYTIDNTPWDALPENVVFKFREKYGERSRMARYSVARRNAIGKGRYMRMCYEEKTAVAQAYTEPLHLEDGSPTQAILMCSGRHVVTGYLQVAPPGTFVINDKLTRKGPLILT